MGEIEQDGDVKKEKLSDKLEKHGFTKIDQNSLYTFLVVCATQFSFSIFKLHISIFKFSTYYINLTIFGILNIVLFTLGMNSFKNEKKKLKLMRYSPLLKAKIPEWTFITSYVLLIAMFALSLILHIQALTLILEFLYVFSTYIFILVYLISAMLPYNYDKKLKEEIGNFYSTFSKKNISLGKVINMINDNMALNCFVRPIGIKANQKINSQTIVNNLKDLKNESLDSYFKLKAKMQAKGSSHFWNILSISVGLGSIFITLYSKQFFNDLINSVIGQGNSINEIKSVFEMSVAMIFVIVIVGLLKYIAVEANQTFYKVILMYFEEAEND